MNDEELLGYLLKLHTAADHAAIEARLAADLTAQARLAMLRRTLEPLECDRTVIEPPAGLAQRTVARLAAHLAESAASPRTNAFSSSRLPIYRRTDSRDHLEPRSSNGRFRAELIVAFGIGFIALGMGFSLIGKLRQQSDSAACTNNLRSLHVGLATYADTHADHFPQVGVNHAYPTAGSFVAALKEAGQFPTDFSPNCPTAIISRGQDAGVPYTYTLGYRSPQGGLVGLSRSSTDESDLMPIAADYPASCDQPCDEPLSPHARGQNVLYVGGNVRFTTTAQAGLNGDHIYRNQLGHVSAGVDRNDTVLGRTTDRP